jgi:hypothetical protein
MQTSTVTRALNCLVVIIYSLGSVSSTTLVTSTLPPRPAPHSALPASQTAGAVSTTQHTTPLLKRLHGVLQEYRQHPMVGTGPMSQTMFEAGLYNRADVPIISHAPALLVVFYSRVSGTLRVRHQRTDAAVSAWVSQLCCHVSTLADAQGCIGIARQHSSYAGCGI